MIDFDFLTTKSRIGPLSIMEPGLAVILERLFFAWISGIAALIFLGALLLAVVRVISWGQLLYVYGGVVAVTLALAGLLYVARRD
jgi:hypothetical protein